MDTIIVPVDGATNIKLEVFDFETLTPLASDMTDTPTAVIDGLLCNRTGAQFDWYDETIRILDDSYRKSARVIAPVARGASGGFVAEDNTLTEIPGEQVTLSYAHAYPERVEARFAERAGDAGEFFRETGSVRDFPGSLTLLKRFVFEEMERPDVIRRAHRFAPLGVLISGHFLDGGFTAAAEKAGNEHSSWMCHTGARNICGPPGAPSTVAASIPSFKRLVPLETAVVYEPLGAMSHKASEALGFTSPPLVIPGGHDTCLSHIPVMATFFRAFPDYSGMPLIHIDAGSWTMAARIGADPVIPPDGYMRDIIVQGTVDGQPVVTARYGGGNDFAWVKREFTRRGGTFPDTCDEERLAQVLRAADTFIVPNLAPVNHGTGPFPACSGRIVNGEALHADPGHALVVANLTTAYATSQQVEAVSGGSRNPIVLTGGGARDPYFGRLLATITGCDVFAVFDCEGRPLSETTSLGAAVAGKAAVLGIHPYLLETDGLCLEYRTLEPFPDGLHPAFDTYIAKLEEEIQTSLHTG